MKLFFYCMQNIGILLLFYCIVEHWYCICACIDVEIDIFVCTAICFKCHGLHLSAHSKPVVPFTHNLLIRCNSSYTNVCAIINKQINNRPRSLKRNIQVV